MTRALSTLLVFLALVALAPSRGAVGHAEECSLRVGPAGPREVFPEEGLVDLSEIEEVEGLEDLESEDEDEVDVADAVARTRRRQALLARADHRLRGGQLVRSLRSARGPPSRA